MTETQQDIDALLAEVNALATQAVEEIAGDTVMDAAPRATPAPIASPPQSSPPIAPSVRPPGRVSGQTRHGNSSDNLHRILHLEVPVIVQLAERTMPFTEILNLTSGAIIEFDKPSDSELDLMINNKCIGRGQAVKVGENFGLRINTIGTIHDRIAALSKA